MRWNQAPTEDAAMLLRYAEHVAQGHGFVWNIGDPPLDGATDFLFVVAVAAVARLGTSVETAARVLGALAHIVTVFLVYFVPRRLFRASPVLCAAIALFVAAGPAKLYIASAFGTTFFGVWVALLWTAALVAMERRSLLADGALPVLACLLGMARPEGAILAVAVMMSVAASRRRGVAGSAGRWHLCAVRALVRRARRCVLPRALALIRASTAKPVLREGRRTSVLVQSGSRGRQRRAARRPASGALAAGVCERHRDAAPAPPGLAGRGLPRRLAAALERDELHDALSVRRASAHRDRGTRHRGRRGPGVA